MLLTFTLSLPFLLACGNEDASGSTPSALGSETGSTSAPRFEDERPTGGARTPVLC